MASKRLQRICRHHFKAKEISVFLAENVNLAPIYGQNVTQINPSILSILATSDVKSLLIFDVKNAVYQLHFVELEEFNLRLILLEKKSGNLAALHSTLMKIMHILTDMSQDTKG